ncbi:hypothetical protein FPQ18DRAFT_387069 [Pyronema domesticum]|nr:hypothetical protein FPQ18DRAFT_387069 [Pyronema domesticum]
MPPALHPKSLSTASLFTSTAILAFLVVGAPHILPCPAPKQQYADDDARQKKSKKKCPKTENKKEVLHKAFEVFLYYVFGA